MVEVDLEDELKSLLEYHRIEVLEWDRKRGTVTLSIEDFQELLRIIDKLETEVGNLEQLAKDFGAPAV